MSNDATGVNKKKQIVIYDPHGLKVGRKEKILDEDSYIQDLEKIISRDFFPDLERLKVQTEYLDALEKNDHTRLRLLHNKYSVLLQRDAGTPAHSIIGSPGAFETAEEAEDDEAKSDRRTKATHNPPKSDDSDLSLDRYLANHTSEDNAVFREIISDLETRRRQRIAWCYEAEEQAKLAIKPSEEPAPLAIEAGPSSSSSTPSKAGGELVPVSSKPSTAPPEASSDAKERPAQPDTWPGYKVHNAVLFVPEGVPFTPAELAKRQADVGARKINYESTRLPGRQMPGEASEESARLREAILSAKAAKSAAAQLQGRVGPDGKELFPAGVTPGVRGFSFMAATPSPAPGAAGESPFITWGEVEGTPFALDEVRASPAPLPGGGFRIPEVPERERLAHELAEKAHRRHRTDRAKAMQKLRGRLASPASSLGSTSSRSARLASLSPAALRLSAKIARPGSGARLWSGPGPSQRRQAAGASPLVATPRTPATPRGLTSGLLNLTAKKS